MCILRDEWGVSERTTYKVVTKEIISIKLHNVQQITETAALNTIYRQHSIIQFLTFCREVLGLK